MKNKKKNTKKNKKIKLIARNINARLLKIYKYKARLVYSIYLSKYHLE